MKRRYNFFFSRLVQDRTLSLLFLVIDFFSLVIWLTDGLKHTHTPLVYLNAYNCHVSSPCTHDGVSIQVFWACAVESVSQWRIRNLDPFLTCCSFSGFWDQDIMFKCTEPTSSDATCACKHARCWRWSCHLTSHIPNRYEINLTGFKSQRWLVFPFLIFPSLLII